MTPKNTGLLEQARLTASKHMLRQADVKVVTWERRLHTTGLTAQDRRKLMAELDLWKKIAAMAAREVRRWSPPDTA